MSDRYGSRLVLALSLGALASCSVPADVELANGSSESITVIYSRGAGERMETRLATASKGEIRTLLGRGDFSIELREKTLRFGSPGVPKEYVKFSFRSRKIKARFAADSCIYLVRPEGDSLTTPVSRDGQPAGFPLCPD